MKKNKVAVIVAGMHRSGTSAITRAINLLGADISNDLMPSTEANPLGYWESNEVYLYHENFLRSYGLSWDSVLDLPKNWHLSKSSKEAKVWIENYIENEFSTSQLFVIKDPRFCRLLPLWKSALKTMDISPRIVIPFRKPTEVALSLDKRVKTSVLEEEDCFRVYKAYLLWLKYLIEVEKASRNSLRSFVNYDSLLQNWKSVFDQMEKDLQIEWIDNHTEVTSFLSPDLNRSKQERHKEKRQYSWIFSIFAALKKLEKDPYDAQAIKVFDEVNGYLQKASSLYGLLLQDEFTDNQQLKKRNYDLSEQIHVATENSNNNRLLKNDIFEKIESQGSRFEAAIAKLEQQNSTEVADLNIKLQSSEAIIAKIEQQNSTEVADLNIKLQNSEAIIAKLEQQNSTEVAELNVKLQSSEAAIAKLEQQNREEVAELNVKLQNSEAAITKLEQQNSTEVAELNVKLQSSEAAIAKLEQQNRAEVEELNVKLQSSEATIAKLNSKIEKETRVFKQTIGRLQKEGSLTELSRSTERRKLQKQFSVVLEESNKLALEKSNRLVEELSYVNSERQNLTNEVTDLSLEVKDLTREVKDLTNEVDRHLREQQSFLTDVETANYSLLRQSRFFNPKWYLKTYPDVLDAKMDPIEHYLKIGYKEKRNPSLWFDTQYYIDRNPDLMSSDTNPLVNYIKAGYHKNHLPRPPSNWKINLKRYCLDWWFNGKVRSVQVYVKLLSLVRR